MSITFGISNDLDTSKVEEFPCYKAGSTCRDPACPNCKGTGQITFRASRWTINLSNANANLVLEALGIDPQEGGVNPNRLLKALQRTPTHTFERPGAETARDVYCPITEPQAKRYWDRLHEIALEAAKREERVCWG